MASRGTIIEHKPGDVKDFYDVVCLTRSLSTVRGNRIKPISSAESEGFGVAKCRRDFADAIAYFCAYDGCPDSVTAVALGKRNNNVVLWVASNANVPKKVIRFLETDVLSTVMGLARAYTKQGQLPLGEPANLKSFLDKILQFGSKKIFKYYKGAIGAWEKFCQFSNPQDKNNTDLHVFCNWFQKEFYKSGDILKECNMPGLALRCYFAREKNMFRVLSHGSGQGNEQRLVYERLYKLLNKLGKHVGLFKKMMNAIDALRHDFQEGFVVERIPASIPIPNPLSELKGRDMGKIVARVFRRKDERDQFYHHLHQFYDESEVSQDLQKCEKGRARVHAEILLIDYFDKFDANFLDNGDKYIGRSKPACYLCYQYIRQHPGNYTLPPTHQKLYHAWSLPIVGANDRNCIEKFDRHRRFLLHVTETLRSDLRNEVQYQVAKRKHHADSTAGASSIVDTGGARPAPKTSNNPIQALMQLLSEAGISAKCDVDLEEGGVLLHC